MYKGASTSRASEEIQRAKAESHARNRTPSKSDTEVADLGADRGADLQVAPAIVPSIAGLAAYLTGAAEAGAAPGRDAGDAPVEAPAQSTGQPATPDPSDVSVAAPAPLAQQPEARSAAPRDAAAAADPVPQAAAAAPAITVAPAGPSAARTTPPAQSAAAPTVSEPAAADAGDLPSPGPEAVTAPADPDPSEPVPTEPDPFDPDPSEPDPTEPDPVDPDPSEPAPVDPDTVDPDPVDPDPVEPPVVIPVWEPAQDLAGTFSEDAAAGTIVLSLPPEDAQGNPVTYALTDAQGTPLSGAGFVLEDGALRLAPDGAPDFETAAGLTLHVTATTGGGTSGPWPVTLTVTDVAEDLRLGDRGESFTDTGVAELSVTGGAGDDTVAGHDDGAVLDGGAGADHLSGGAASDLLTGGADDDELDGGAGTDTAAYSGAWTDYRITRGPDGALTVADLRPGSPDGTDTLVNVEILRFADGEVAVTDALNDTPEVRVTPTAVAENDAGATAGTVVVLDPDLNHGDSVTLAVDDPRLEVRDGTLRLRDGQTFDYEVDGPTVTLTVTVTDTAGESHSQTVTIAVTDVNEAAISPLADTDAAPDALAENAAPGTHVGLAAFAEDTDGTDSVTYALSDDAGGRFAIDPQTGLVTATGPLDHEAAPSHTIEVTATSTDGSTVTRTFTIAVTDVNEAPVLTSGQTATVAEGETLATTVAGVSDAGESLSYAIAGGPDAALFAIDPATGALTFVTPPDYEAPADQGADNIYEVVVAVSDGTFTDSHTLAVTVTGVNEAPVVTVVAGALPENAAGATAGTVAVLDPDLADGDSVTLAVDDPRFEVRDGTLRLRDGQALDYEADGPSVTLTVTATDTAGESHSQTVTVPIEDLAEDIVLGDGGAAFTDGGVAETSVTGGAGADTLQGHDDGAALSGDGGSDALTGGAGTDLLTGGAGDDSLAGGAGADTAVFTGAWTDYEITQAPDGTLTVADLRDGAPDGTDILTGIETLRFSDGDRSPAEALNSAPTGIVFAASSDIGTELPTETVVTGRIRSSSGATSVDHWAIGHAGGDLEIDVLAMNYGGGTLDSDMRLYRVEPDGSLTPVLRNDDGLGYDDGSTAVQDSYIMASDLPAGDYILAIGAYPVSDAEALSTTSGYPNTDGQYGYRTGPYQITLSGEATVTVAPHPSGTGDWGNPGGDATVVSVTEGGNTLEPGTVVATVTAVADADAGDSHSFALADDAGGAVAIDAGTGALSLTGDPRGPEIWQDSVTVTATDALGDSHSQTLGVTLGTESSDLLTGTAGSDAIFAFGGDDTIAGGAGDDTIRGGTDSQSSGGDNIAWTPVAPGASVTGSVGPDLFSWTPASGGDTAEVTFPNSFPPEIGDGAGDYLYVTNTQNSGLVIVRGFETGQDMIILQEPWWDFTHTQGDGVAEFTVTYLNGNTQSFRVHHGGTFLNPAEVFTTTIPDHLGGEQDADTVVYAGDLADYDVSFDAATGSFTITDRNAQDGLDEGTDLVSGVGIFEFNGVTYTAADLRAGPNAAPTGIALAADPGLADISKAAAGTTIAQVTGVADPDEGDTHTLSLSGEAGGVLSLNAATGRIALTQDPRAGGAYEGGFTLTATDARGAEVSLDFGLGLGSEAADTLAGTAGNDILHGFGGADTLSGGAGDDTLIGGSQDSGPGADIAWTTVTNGETQLGSGGRDHFTWTATGTDYYAEIGLNGDPHQGAGDGLADTVVVQTTDESGWLVVGGFDLGLDRIVLQEEYASISVRLRQYSNEFTVTYANGNTQSYRVNHDGGTTGSPAEVFTWTMPDDLALAAGADTAAYAGDLADFDISYNAATGTFTLTDLDTADGLDEGTDLVSGIEAFSFAGVQTDAASLMGQSAIAADAFDHDLSNDPDAPPLTADGGSGGATITQSGDRNEVIYARGANDTVTSSGGDDLIYAGSGDDIVTAGAGDDTIYGGTGDDLMSGGEGSDLFTVTALQGSDTIDGGAGWTDVIELAGFSGGVTVSGSTVDGQGWTLVLDDGFEIAGQTLDGIELGGAAGTITFDEGGVIDFTGIERIGF